MPNKKIKVLYTIPNFKTAGSQYVVLSLFKHIDTSKFEPYVAVEKFPELKPEIIPEENFLYLPKSGNNFTDLKQIIRILKKKQIKIVHSWDYKSTSIEALGVRLAGCKYLYTKKNDAWSKRWLLKSLISTHIAYDHPEMKTKFFNTFYLRRKISFIPHGVDEKHFHKEKLSQSKNDEIVRLGCVGNINANKNQLFIIKNMKSLPDHIHLYLYGKADENYLADIKAYLSQYQLSNRVHLEGFVANNDLPDILNQLDVFLLASKKEGLPVSILEALACETPVLASDSGGGTAYIASEGDGVLIFETDNDREFLDGISKLYKDEALRNGLGKEGRVLVEKKFTLKMELNTYEKLYQKLVY
ncbi:MAG: glycosyltransferase family 4 protein [Mesonia sp.]|uniref:glycosyltransferase family 4 protein n=1 Tax=Mesonia sp. TaxID=1960830 RepID=UPI003241FCB0